MALEGVQPTISVHNIVRAKTGSRVHLPVAHSGALYAHFKHVAGYPAPPDSGSYSINKLRAMNNLVERLNKIKGLPELAMDSDVNITDRIQKLAQELTSRLSADTAGFQKRVGIEPGMLINLVA